MKNNIDKKDKIVSNSYDNGVDFIIISFDLPKFDYVRLCVESIIKYWDSIEYTIYIIVNYENKDEIDFHKQFFKDNSNIVILEGVNQKDNTIRGTNAAVTHNNRLVVLREGQVVGNTFHKGKIDGCQIAAGGINGSLAFNKAFKYGNREYICTIDRDAIFLSNEALSLIPLTDKYCFISNRYCPEKVFNKSGGGIARDNLFFSKRSFFDMIEDEKYVEKEIWSYSPRNCDYRDMSGNLTWYAEQKGLKFLVLKNSYRDSFREDNGLWKKHILNITHPYSEQAWLNDKPIFFHHGRGGYRRSSTLSEWVEEVEKYLNIS